MHLASRRSTNVKSLAFLGREVAGQDVAVKGVDAYGRGRATGQHRGQSADRAGLGHVSVKDVRLDPAGAKRVIAEQRLRVVAPELPA